MSSDTTMFSSPRAETSQWSETKLEKKEGLLNSQVASFRHSKALERSDHTMVSQRERAQNIKMEFPI